MLVTIVAISLTQYVFSEIDPIQINVSIPLEGSSEFCGKINTCFIPIEVITLVGAEITWTNNDLSNAHTVTSGDVVVGPEGIFGSGLLGPGQIFSYVFENAGIFPYYCIIHPWKEGVIKISNQDSKIIPISQLSDDLSPSSANSDIERIKQENVELRKQVRELQAEIKKLKLLVLEQIKVINQWLGTR